MDSPIGVMIFERAGSTRTLKNHDLFTTTRSFSVSDIRTQGTQHRLLSLS